MKTFFFLMFMSLNSYAMDISCKYKEKIKEFSGVNSEKIHFIEKKEGKTYIYHIENTSKFSEANDYVEIKNKQHSVMFVLMCEKK